MNGHELLSADATFRWEDLLSLAERLEESRQRELAATAWDRAYGLRPGDARVASRRQRLLDELSVRSHGLTFRYVPAGPFRMGSLSGEDDEHPVHAVELDGFWLTEAPLTWVDCTRIAGWLPPPTSAPDEDYEAYYARPYAERENDPWYSLREGEFAKTRSSYCMPASLRENELNYEDENPGWYDQRPMVVIDWTASEWLGRVATERAGELGFAYRLPTEAEWEKAARGGLIDQAQPWGDEPPGPLRCDFDSFESFKLEDPRAYPPNGYGLYAMCGSVWEWTGDWYDAKYYESAPRKNPTGPAKGKQRVVRGGCWADCGGVVSVSFRASMKPDDAPANVGLRLVRYAQRTG